jgi:GntR family transcriptional regulator
VKTANTKIIAARPLYAQVADQLRERILDLEWSNDGTLPNEWVLANEFGVSVGTVRKAVEALERERLVVRRQGRGTFVTLTNSDADTAHFVRLVSDETVVAPRMRVLHMTRTKPDDEERKRLRLEAGEDVIRIVRIAQSTIAMHETISLRSAGFPEIETHTDLEAHLLFGVYWRDYGVRIARAQEEITSVTADPTIAVDLGIAPGTPLLALTRSAVSDDSRFIELSRRLVEARGLRYNVSI